MIPSDLNLNNLRVFLSVFKTRSMTLAAKELHLTQSGVSQHIKSLEESISVALFDRINKRLVPTQAGTLLSQQCSRILHDLEDVMHQIQGGDRKLHGVVTIGMPIEFGNNVIIPAISKFAQKHPDVKFIFKVGYASAMNALLIDGILDFAFVDEYQMDRRIEMQDIYDEVVYLCASSQLIKKIGPVRFEKKFFEKLPYVAYQPDEPVLRQWFQHHLGTKKPKLKVVACVFDVQGVARFIINHMGAGVIPKHLLDRLIKSGHKIQVFKHPTKVVKNKISMARLKEKTHSAEATASMDWLVETLKKNAAH